MKHFICLAVMSCLFTCSACAQAQDLSRYDLSTDEGVAAAREALSGKKLDEDSKGCVRRSAGLPRIVIVGDFAHDLGCSFQGAFIGSKYFEGDGAPLSQAALNFVGWQAAKPYERERIARLWVEKGLLAFLIVPEQKDEDFKDRPFQPPRAITNRDGEVIVTLWIRQPPGMNRERVYQLLEYRFAGDGALAGKKVLDSLVVQF